ncbi:transposase [Natrialba swarupiae]|uniref:Transposase n=1 Tax=Natrialba swarupiae TaxID=2448032 RepID=A0A5D5AQL2_9EURY|nr:transposase [Natrialba swarupiae]TYT61760.1 transposase [Natrialba swarupiae]
MGTEEPPEPRTSLQKEAAALLDADNSISAVELVTELSFPLVDNDDQYPSWHPSKPLDPMVRALFLKEFYEDNNSETARRVAAADTAEQLGFESPPSRSALRRTWLNRFSDDLCTYLSRNANWVREYCRKSGHPLGTTLAPDEERGGSERTKERVIKEKLQSVPQETARLLQSELDFLPQRAENATYPPTAFIEAESTMGIEQQAAETGCKSYGDLTPRESGAPAADTHLHYIKQLSQSDILEMMDETTDLILSRAKDHFEFDRCVTVAIDITYIAYYGDERNELVLGSPSDEKYKWCYQFAAISIVGDNTKFFLAMRPVRENVPRGEIVRELISEANQYVNVQTVYADREFATTDVVQSLEDFGVEYVIPVPRNQRIKRAIDRMNNYIEVRHEYGFYGSTVDGPTNDRVETTLVLLPSKRDEDGKELKAIPFYTNKDISDETARDRRATDRVLNRYRKRWGIETSFKSVKQFLPWTTSNEHVVRMFHFAFAMILYNMWRLVDFLVKKSLDREFSHAPVVRGKRFVGRMRVVYTR